MDETNEGLLIPDDVQNNCWWMREMKKSLPDDLRINFMDKTNDKYQMIKTNDDIQNNCW